MCNMVNRMLLILLLYWNWNFITDSRVLFSLSNRISFYFPLIFYVSSDNRECSPIVMYVERPLEFVQGALMHNSVELQVVPTRQLAQIVHIVDPFHIIWDIPTLKLLIWYNAIKLLEPNPFVHCMSHSNWPFYAV